MTVGLTVLFSTFNGAESLPRMFDALDKIEPPVSGWKLVAVNNASTDATADILRVASNRLPITVVNEPRRGKNIGLNAGLPFVDGDLTVLTDDDVVPRSDWLVSALRVAESHRDYDIFGGVINPLFEKQPMDWVLHCVSKGALAWTDFPEGPIDPMNVWGPNMAVRTDVLRRHRFNEGIGPDGSARYAMGSETEFTRRAASAGHRCWHSHEMVVEHIIHAHQVTPEWLLQRAYNQGRGWRRLAGVDADRSLPHVLGVPRYLMRELIASYLRTIFLSCRGDAAARFDTRLRHQQLLGDLSERRAIRRTSKAEAPVRHKRERTI